MKQILFVDDEPKILEALKRMLYPCGGEWCICAALSAEEALALMNREPVDVLVADIHMPGMNGIELLAAVEKQYPQIVRVVLSGTADEEWRLRALRVAHQYLAKPSSAATLKSVLNRALSLQGLQVDPAIKQFLSDPQASAGDLLVARWKRDVVKLNRVLNRLGAGKIPTYRDLIILRRLCKEDDRSPSSSHMTVEGWGSVASFLSGQAGRVESQCQLVRTIHSKGGSTREN